MIRNGLIQNRIVAVMIGDRLLWQIDLANKMSKRKGDILTYRLNYLFLIF